MGWLDYPPNALMPTLIYGEHIILMHVVKRLTLDYGGLALLSGYKSGGG